MLKAYITGQLADPQFALPGCRPGTKNGFCRYRTRSRSEQIAEHSLLRCVLEDTESSKCNQQGRNLSLKRVQRLRKEPQRIVGYLIFLGFEKHLKKMKKVVSENG